MHMHSFKVGSRRPTENFSLSEACNSKFDVKSHALAREVSTKIEAGLVINILAVYSFSTFFASFVAFHL